MTFYKAQFYVESVFKGGSIITISLASKFMYLIYWRKLILKHDSIVSNRDLFTEQCS